MDLQMSCSVTCWLACDRGFSPVWLSLTQTCRLQSFWWAIIAHGKLGWATVAHTNISPIQNWWATIAFTNQEGDGRPYKPVARTERGWATVTHTKFSWTLTQSHRSYHKCRSPNTCRPYNSSPLEQYLGDRRSYNSAAPSPVVHTTLPLLQICMGHDRSLKFSSLIQMLHTRILCLVKIN